MRYKKGCLLALALVIAITLPIAPAMALPAMSIPFFTVGTNVPMFYVNPQQAATLFIQETNQSHLAATDTEALGISFPARGTGPLAKPVFAPDISQTDSRTIVGDITYTFIDFTST